jgi:hypothetical protein
MTSPTLQPEVIEALRSAGATEEIIAAAVKTAGELGNSPRRRGGRPRKYADRAARNRAYRAQKKPRVETPKLALNGTSCAMKCELKPWQSDRQDVRLQIAALVEEGAVPSTTRNSEPAERGRRRVVGCAAHGGRHGDECEDLGAGVQAHAAAGSDVTAGRGHATAALFANARHPRVSFAISFANENGQDR